jgi:hypothetical protein
VKTIIPNLKLNLFKIGIILFVGVHVLIFVLYFQTKLSHGKEWFNWSEKCVMSVRQHCSISIGLAGSADLLFASIVTRYEMLTLILHLIRTVIKQTLAPDNVAILSV